MQQGEVLVGDAVHVPNEKGSRIFGKVQKLFKALGQEKIEITKGIAGDIITMAAINPGVNETINHI